MELTKEIKEILENVVCWDTCLQEYKDKISTYLKSVNESETLDMDLVSGCFPTEKEVEEAAESFGNLYSLDPNFGNGCEAGWKAGAEWMKQKHNDY